MSLSAWDAPFWWPHEVTVEDAIQSGGSGAKFDAPRSVKAEVRDEQRIVIGADASEHVSNTQVTVPLSAAVPVGSMVTVWAGRVGARRARVIAVQRDENPPPLPSHLILSLQ